MKYLIVTIGLLLSTTFTFSQNSNLPIDEETNLITYRDVVEEKGNKESFFNSAIGWINEYYANPVNVTKTRDAESGIIKGLHRFKLKRTDDNGNTLDAGVIQYRFTLEFKEGRYRYTLYEFVLRQSSKIPAEKWLEKSDPQSKSRLEQIEEFANSWIEALKEGMTPKVEKSDDDW